MSTVLCPPSCSSRCCIEHHPLLVATLNCPTDASDAAVAHWRNVVLGFQQTGKWNWSSPIPDSVQTYRMPILHWACYLGKVSIVKYMLRHAGSKSVALSPTEHALYSQLTHGEVAGGNTPIHLCCEMLANCNHDVLPSGNKYVRCLDQLLYFIASRRQDQAQNGLRWTDAINTKNSSGDTPLHIVARNDALHSVVGQLINAGATRNTFSSSSFTPLDIAKQCNNAQIVHALTNTEKSEQDYDDDDDDDVVIVKVEQTTASDYKIRSLPDTIDTQLSLQCTLSRFGLSLSHECSADEMKNCLNELQSSNDASLIESVRAAVIQNFNKLELHQERLLATLADMDSESTVLDVKHQADIDDIHHLDSKYACLQKKKKHLAKQSRQTEHKVDSLRSRRRSIARWMSDKKGHHR